MSMGNSRMICLFVFIHLLIHQICLATDSLVEPNNTTTTKNKQAFSSETIKCVGHVHRHPNSACLQFHILLQNFTVNNLINALSHADSLNYNHRQMRISFLSKLKIHEVGQIGVIIDHFLTPRIEWQLIKEPYHAHQTHENEDILLEKYNIQYEKYLKLLNAIQYPEKETCENAPMMVGRDSGVHPGLSSVLEMLFLSRSDMPFTVQATHVSLANQPADEGEYTSWILPRECNTTVDKWQCAFLPVTNCTVPDEITKCNTTRCVLDFPNVVRTSVLVDRGSATGHVVLPGSDLARDATVNKKFNHPHSELQKKLESGLNIEPFTERLPYNPNIANSRGTVDSSFSLYVNKFLLRTNYFYRTKIAQQTHQFYMKNNISSETRCVSAQIRRGDRIIHGVNMTELCHNATVGSGQCLDDQHNLVDCEAVKYDKGCESELPLGSVTMDHVVHAAKQLVSPDVRNIFVFTDDEAWFQSEKKRVAKKYPDWNFYMQEAPKPPANYFENTVDEPFKDYFYMRHQGGSASGSYFIGSLQLTQQCEALIGHFESSVASLFHSNMCVQHGNGRYHSVCPPVIDLGQKLKDREKVS